MLIGRGFSPVHNANRMSKAFEIGQLPFERDSLSTEKGACFREGAITPMVAAGTSSFKPNFYRRHFCRASLASFHLPEFAHPAWPTLII